MKTREGWGEGGQSCCFAALEVQVFVGPYGQRAGEVIVEEGGEKVLPVRD